MFPFPHPQNHSSYICIHEILGGGPEWLCDDYIEARPVTVDLFLRQSILFLFFLIHYFWSFILFFLHKWDRIKTGTTPSHPPQPEDMAFLIQKPRSCVCFHAHESMLWATKLRRHLQDQLAHDDAHHEEQHDEGHWTAAQPLLFLHGNRRVLRRHHVALPHPKAIILLAQRKERVSKCVCVYMKCKRKYCEPMTGSGVSGRASDERVKRTSQFRQSVDTIRLYLFTSSKKLDLLKSSSDPIPLGLHKAPSLNTL